MNITMIKSRCLIRFIVVCKGGAANCDLEFGQKRDEFSAEGE